MISKGVIWAARSILCRFNNFENSCMVIDSSNASHDDITHIHKSIRCCIKINELCEKIMKKFRNLRDIHPAYQIGERRLPACLFTNNGISSPQAIPYTYYLRQYKLCDENLCLITSIRQKQSQDALVIHVLHCMALGGESSCRDTFRLCLAMEFLRARRTLFFHR